MMQLSKVFVVMVLLVSCGINDPEGNLEGERLGTVYMEYNGMVWVEGGFAPNFSLVNDSSATIHYYRLSETQPVFNAEARTDTGWTSLMWGWRGTGVEYFSLNPDSSISFRVFLPYYSCTWRLVLDITELDSVSSHRLYSENIVYTLPKEMN